MKPDFHPKSIISEISEKLLAAYAGKALIDRYDVYQHLMNYWFEVMQDDCYQITADGWKAVTYRIIETNNKGKQVDKGWTCDLIPKVLVINRFFSDEKQVIDNLNVELERIQNKKAELEEEHSGEDGVFSEFDKINKVNISARLKELKNEKDEEEEKILKQYLDLLSHETSIKRTIAEKEAFLDENLLKYYGVLTEEIIKQLIVEDKWMVEINSDIHSEMDRITQRLANRIKELAERYEKTLPVLNNEASALENAVSAHLERMGFVWN